MAAMERLGWAAAVGALAIMVLAVPATPASAIESRFGCYRVVGAASLTIRSRALARSEAVGYARRGEKLAKRRRFCALRGFWCPVRRADGLSGWADKRFLRRTAC